MPTIKEDYKAVKLRHDILKREAEQEIHDAVKVAIDKFHEKSGCLITGISFDMYRHYTCKIIDEAVIRSINLETDIGI